METAIGLLVSVLVLIGIGLSSLSNKGDLARFQELKNKRRFGGKKLPAHEQEELDRLTVKYWWY